MCVEVDISTKISTLVNFVVHFLRFKVMRKGPKTMFEIVIIAVHKRFNDLTRNFWVSYILT